MQPGRSAAAGGLTEKQLAAISGSDADLSDDALASQVATSRTAAMRAWIRIGCPSDPPSDGPLGVALRARVAEDLLMTARLRTVVGRLAGAGIEPILLKGAALSHGVYPWPWLRPRNDDDLLVDREAFEPAGRVLTELGYESCPANPGWEHTGQGLFTKAFASGEMHHVDLHWRALIPAAFGSLPGHAALRAAARPLPALGDVAWQVAPALALVMACAHRVAHHAPDEDPIWLVDTHLLACRLDEAGWDALVGAATAARVAAVCRFELARAAGRLGTIVPAPVGERLGAVRGEPSERHLRARGRLHRLWLDLGDHPDGRWRALAAHVWPSSAYMTARYGRTPAPVAYLWRAGAGAAHWLAEAARRPRSR